MQNKENPYQVGHAGLMREKEDYDPSELYSDLDLDEARLIELDPLVITARMVEQAEHPELENPIIAALPPDTCHGGR